MDDFSYTVEKPLAEVQLDRSEPDDIERSDVELSKHEIRDLDDAVTIAINRCNELDYEVSENSNRFRTPELMAQAEASADDEFSVEACAVFLTEQKAIEVRRELRNRKERLFDLSSKLWRDRLGRVSEAEIEA